MTRGYVKGPSSSLRAIVLITGLLTAVVTYSRGDLMCLSCKMAVHPHDCETIIKCGTGESCVLETVVTTLGYLRYNVGCRDNRQCVAASQTGRRSTDFGMMVCMECCTTPLCNSGGCGLSAFPDRAVRGPLCYNCQEQRQDMDCNRITMCGVHQMCRFRRTYNQVTFDQLYSTSCSEPNECSMQSGVLCDNCCQQDLCNHECNSTTLHPTTMSKQITTTSSSITTAPSSISTTSSSISTTSSRAAMMSSSTTMSSDPCIPSPCVIGTCSHYLDTYKCTCPHGVRGRNCDIYSDPCLSNPCRHGQCKSVLNTFTCTCNHGYTGDQCNTVIDHCLSNPCYHGNCANSRQGYTCACDLGYTGTTCDTVVDHCLLNPCYHGNCSNSLQGYTCACDPGYTGTTCDTVIDHCASNPCNHGNCSNGPQCYTCTCDLGYTGKTCDAVIDHCLSNPCDHGNCSSNLRCYTCACDLGYTGTTCDTLIDHCQSNPCCHGNCSNSLLGYTCACDPGYTGTTCDIDKRLHGVHTCTFETSGDLCGWTQSKNDTFEFQSMACSTMSSETGPRFDHTFLNSSGHYLYLEASSPAKQGDSAALVSFILPANQDVCLSFYYHMYGSGMGSLHVYVLDAVTKQLTQIFKSFGDQGDAWHSLIMAVHASNVPHDFRFMIKAVVGSGDKSDIAIDDLTIKPCGN